MKQALYVKRMYLLGTLTSENIILMCTTSTENTMQHLTSCSALQGLWKVDTWFNMLSWIKVTSSGQKARHSFHSLSSSLLHEVKG